MLQNLHFPNDIRYTVEVNRLTLTVIGVWPLGPDPSRLTKVLRRFLIVSCFLLLVFSVVPCLLYTLVKLETFQARVRMVGGLCFYCMALIIYSAMILHEDQIATCIAHIEQDWRTVRTMEDRGIMLEKARVGRSITIFAILFLYSTAVIYRIVLPLCKGKIVVNENITIRPLVHSTYFVFFDPQSSPAYEIVFTVQCASAVIIYAVTSGVCGLAALFVMHICGQLEILVSWLEDFGRERAQEKEQDVRYRFAVLVEHHVRIRRFLRKVETVLQEICLFEVIGCTLILCLLEYYVIMEWERNSTVALLTYTAMFSCFSFNIFILCYIGETLISQGGKVYNTSCTLNWSHMRLNHARCLIFIIAMSNRPMKMTAGKFLDLSLSNFGAVFKTSLAYLNLLRSVTV